MAINIRQKGQNGEREIADMLNSIYLKVLQDNGLPEKDKRDHPFQRNQNQSAVGGSDLSNPFNLDIEVKRQENLSINTWWKQCVESAKRSGGEPVLVFKQNRKAWRVMLMCSLETYPGNFVRTRCEIDIKDFQAWAYSYLTYRI